MSPSSTLTQIRAEATGFCVAAHGSLVIAVWGRAVVAHDLDQLAQVQREMISEYGHFSVLSIVRAGLSMSVDEDVRLAGQRNLREFEAQNRGSALVVEAGGLRASFFRSVVTGVHFVSRSQVPHKVFDTIDTAVRWLLSCSGVDAQTAASPDEVTASAHTIADNYGTR